jgi:hypothetical protein
MARLSTSDYLFFCSYLHEVWQTERQAFSLISTRDQWYLHQYFRPSDDLTPRELLAHREAITQEQPSLPQCAGRALRHLADPKPLRVATGSKQIRVYSMIRSEPDIPKLARALMRSTYRFTE